jgi:hypothetical protein
MRKKLGRPRIKQELKREYLLQIYVSKKHAAIFRDAAMLSDDSLSSWAYKSLKETAFNELKLAGVIEKELL